MLCITQVGVHGHLLKNRAWQRKLYALVQDSINREELYKCLHMLLTTTEESTFSELLGKFIVSWRSKEPSFVDYFKTSYAGRPGIYRHYASKLM